MKILSVLLKQYSADCQLGALNSVFCSHWLPCHKIGLELNLYCHRNKYAYNKIARQPDRKKERIAHRGRGDGPILHLKETRVQILFKRVAFIYIYDTCKRLGSNFFPNLLDFILIIAQHWLLLWSECDFLYRNVYYNYLHPALTELRQLRCHFFAIHSPLSWSQTS